MCTQLHYIYIFFSHSITAFLSLCFLSASSWIVNVFGLKEVEGEMHLSPSLFIPHIYLYLSISPQPLLSPSVFYMLSSCPSFSRSLPLYLFLHLCPFLNLFLLIHRTLFFSVSIRGVRYTSCSIIFVKIVVLTTYEMKNKPETRAQSSFSNATVKSGAYAQSELCRHASSVSHKLAAPPLTASK